ncbi:MAG: prolyl oligopeptidase family serine peptidase [Bacteroidia bacterium]
MKKALPFLFAGSTIFAACNQQKTEEESPLVYPETRKVDQIDEYFGTLVNDPYRWLEDDMSDETKAWVAAQNEVSFGYLDKIPFRNSIKDRLELLWNYEKFSAPFKEGRYTYFYKNDGLQNQAVLYRQLGSAEAEVFLDPNAFSEGGTTSLAGISFTKDGSLCAYQISEGGSDWRKVIVMDTESKQIVEDTLMDVKFSGISWRGNEGFYYSSYDKPKEGSQLSGKTQYHKLYFHKLGSQQAEDVLVFGGDQQPRRYIAGYLTEDERFIVITAANATYGRELYLQDLSKPNNKIETLVSGFENEHSIIHHENGLLYILTNLDAPNRKIVTAPANKATPEHWKTLIAETENPLSAATAGAYIFCNYLKDAVSMVQQYDLNGQLVREITLPGLGSASGFGGKRSDTEIYYNFTSYVYPPTTFKLDLGSGESELYKQSGVQFDPSQYESRQVFYTSKDGTRVPMIITHKKGLEFNGKNPTLLYGYGGFNVNLTPSFSTSNIVLMENGGVYAVANLRGGGEYGDAWHEAGTQMQKQNVFDDFIAAAEYLIAENYTSSDYLAIAGGSNGGLLVAACMTQRPELFKVCFPAVGVLDMLRYHKFTAGAGWAYDYGTADDSPEMFAYLLAYSPVHNVKAGTSYPATMVTTADHDDRVVPAHSFKFAAALQEGHAGKAPVIIRIDTKAGHGAGKPTSMIIAEQADKWAFMFHNMGLKITY